MSKLLMSYKEIRDSIKITNDWNNILTTNCYAYALGIDIPSNKLMKKGIEYPYGVGNIGRFKEKISFFDIHDLPLEDRLLIDLDALEIGCSSANQFQTLEESENELNWLIAMYKNRDNPEFHFLRKTPNMNYWTHKLGYKKDISCLDSKGAIITNLNNADFTYKSTNRLIDYELKGIYKLSLKR